MDENFEELNKEVGMNEPTKVDEKGFVVENKPEESSETKEDNSSFAVKSPDAHWIVEGVLLAAVIALFILHFIGGGRKTAVIDKPAEVGSGEIVYINIDTINENYELVKILTDSIDADKQKQAVVFQNRQKSLEQKLANFQKNYASGSLTPQQAQYAQQSLEDESNRLQNDYAQALESLEARYIAAQQQMNDSLLAAAKRVNLTYNASYIFAYQGGGGSQLLYADAAHDITQEVLDELNKSFKKKRK